MYPTEVRLNPARTSLSITWESGVTSSFPATLLRERARDARSVRWVVNGRALAAAADLTITAVEPIGNYALRLAFSDGHDRGIYPWIYLADIADGTSRAGVGAR